MKCPSCGSDDTRVTDSRTTSDTRGIRRRRECATCSLRFSTLEEIEILGLTVIKRDGRREAYSRDKLVCGLKKSLQKLPFTEERFKKLVTGIEADIHKLRKSEILSEQVGEAVMRHLRKFDKVGYIRFASVYQSFENLERFEQELKDLAPKRRKRAS